MEDQSKQQTALGQRHSSAEILLRIKAIDDWIPTVFEHGESGNYGNKLSQGSEDISENARRYADF